MALAGGATAKDVADQLGHRDETMVLKCYKLWIPKRGRIRDALKTEKDAPAMSA